MLVFKFKKFNKKYYIFVKSNYIIGFLNYLNKIIVKLILI